MDYEGVQRAIDTGTAEEPPALLREIGRLREDLEVARGGISLNVPEQEIIERPDGYALAYRAPRPADGWNAQLSLLTGMAAADLMLASGTGVLRTLPTAPDGAVARLRRTARALGIDWPAHTSYAALVRTLDPARAAHAAFLQDCTSLLRGAGYTVFDGDPPAPNTPGTPPSPPRTPTSPPRCGASPTATARNCAWPPRPARSRRTGSVRRCPRCPPRWRKAAAGPTGSSGNASTSSRRP